MEVQRRKAFQPEITSSSNTRSKKKQKIFKSLGSEFAYNGRVSLALIPAIIAVLFIGGYSVITTLFFGFLLAFLFDLFEKPQAVFAVFWTGLIFINFQLFYKGAALVQFSIANIFLLGLNSLFCLIVGCWVSLQFHWLHKSSTQSLILMERLIFSMGPLIVPTLITYVGTALFGASKGLYILFGSSIFCQFLIAGDISSSFTRVEDKRQVCNKPEKLVHSVSLLLLPLLFQLGMYYRTFFTLYQLSNLAAIISITLLFLSQTGRLGSELPNEDRFGKQRGKGKQSKEAKYASIVAGVLLLLFIEYRVIFGSLFYFIPIPAPISYFIVTIGLFLFAGVAYFFASGDARQLGRPMVSAVACSCALAVGVSVGMSFIALPALVGAAFFLTAFYFNKKAYDYILFVFLSSMCCLWLVMRSYFFLAVEFRGVSIQLISVMLVLMTAFALMIPVNVFSNRKGVFIAAYAFFLAMLETIIYFGGFESIYPFYFIIFTSGLGIKLVSHLEHEKFINSVTAWVCYVVFSTKLIVLVSNHPFSIVGALAQGLVGTAPHFVHSQPLSVRTGLVYAGAFGIVSLLCSVNVEGAILESIIDQVPTPTMLFGVFMLTWGIGATFLVVRQFPEQPLARRVSFSLVVVGFCLLLVNPQFGLFVSLGGSTPWLVIVSLLVTLFCFRSRYVLVRLCFAATIGVCFGSLVVNTTLIASWTYFFFFSLIFASFAWIINSLYYSSEKLARILPLVFIGFLVLLPITLFAGKLVTTGFAPRLAAEYNRQFRNSLVGVYAGLTILLGLFFKLILSSATPDGKSSTPYSKWSAEVGNAATIIGFVLSCHFCIDVLNSSDYIIYLLSSLMLLLSRDKVLFSWLREENRYSVVLFALFISLGGFSTINVLHQIVIRGRWTWRFVRELILLTCVFPSNYLFCRFAVNQQRQPLIWWLIVTPLNLVALFATRMETFLLGINGLVSCIVYFTLTTWTTHRAKKASI